jgi:hypothetical protein
MAPETSDTPQLWIEIDANHLPEGRCEVWDGVNVVNVYQALTLEECIDRGLSQAAPDLSI